MFWIWICFIIFIASVAYIIFDSFYDLFEKIVLIMISALTSFFGMIIIVFLASTIIGCIADVNYNMVQDTKIIALKDNQNVNGNFYIMGGYVDEELYYYYATETEFGYKTEKVSADNAYIKYTNGETHIERYSARWVKDYINWFAVPMNSDRYVIYCPEGTVTNEFNVDLE